MGICGTGMDTDFDWMDGAADISDNCCNFGAGGGLGGFETLSVIYIILGKNGKTLLTFFARGHKIEVYKLKEES